MRRQNQLPRSWIGLLLLLLALAGLWPSVSKPRAVETQQAVVQRVSDGDTVVLIDGRRVRYIGMDTPELHHPTKPVQYYAREAAEFNRQLVEGKQVRLEYDLERKDKYGRTLAYLYLPDGTFVNAELVRQGYAHTLTIPPNVRYADQFTQLQKEARTARRGLWNKQRQ